jgi:protein-tyrosine-phosphatase
MKRRLLFVCVENSCRSQIAEAFARIHDDELEVHSAGSRPSREINTKAIESMREIGYDLTTHQSKSLAEIPTDSSVVEKMVTSGHKRKAAGRKTCRKSLKIMVSRGGLEPPTR